MRIPSLDGLRAISILLVILGHGKHSLPESWQPSSKFAFLFNNGQLGVHVFFVISGFLITTLLLRELESTGTIRMGTFYFRRAFRIFPAFYVYLLVIAILTAVGWLHIPWKMFLASGTYLWNYLHWSDSWYLGHTWSLAVEEQFYLLWPALLLLLRPKRAKQWAVGIILLSPLLRVASYFVFPETRAYISIMLHTRADALMFGALLALGWQDQWLQNIRGWLKHPAVLVSLGAFLLLLSPWLNSKMRGSYQMTAGYTLEGAAIACLLVFAVGHPDHPLGRMLNMPWIAWFGRISYSLYLWQQLFLTKANPLSQYPPAQFAATLLAATLSYYMVETPLLRLRQRWVR